MSELTPDQIEVMKMRQVVGSVHAELNSIFRRIRRSKSGEPTSKELVRIKELKAQLKELEGVRL